MTTTRPLTRTHALIPAESCCLEIRCPWFEVAQGTTGRDLAALKELADAHAGQTGHAVTTTTSQELRTSPRETA